MPCDLVDELDWRWPNAEDCARAGCDLRAPAEAEGASRHQRRRQSEAHDPRDSRVLYAACADVQALRLCFQNEQVFFGVALQRNLGLPVPGTSTSSATYAPSLNGLLTLYAPSDAVERGSPSVAACNTQVLRD